MFEPGPFFVRCYLCCVAILALLIWVSTDVDHFLQLLNKGQESDLGVKQVWLVMEAISGPTEI